MKARERALQILLRVEQQGDFTQDLLSAARSQEDYALLTNLVKGTLQWRARIDQQLASYLRTPLADLPPPIRALLRLGAYQITFLTNIPKQVSVNETVNLAKKYGHPGTVKLVNAVLRKIVATPLPTEPRALEQAADIASWYSHPEWLVARWCDRFGVTATAELCKRNNEAWPLTLRVNPRRCTIPKLHTLLTEAGIGFKASRWHPDCTVLTELPAHFALGQFPPFRDGFFQIQDESAALVGSLIELPPTARVYDLCSAPGGKTTQIAAKLDRGFVVACELSKRRLAKVVENATRLQLNNIYYLVADAHTPALKPGVDLVLLDAPCSGTGVVGRKSDLRWNKSTADLLRLAHLQGELLKAASHLVRPGGHLLYSTCSIEEEENRQVVEGFLSRNLEFKRVPIQHLPAELFSPEGDLLTLPHVHGIAGSYAALLQRFA